MYEAVIDADALLLLTEWKQFRLPSWAVIKKVMRQPLLLDGRNIYDAKELGELGFTYECIGKYLWIISVWSPLLLLLIILRLL